MWDRGKMWKWVEACSRNSNNFVLHISASSIALAVTVLWDVSDNFMIQVASDSVLQCGHALHLISEQVICTCIWPVSPFSRFLLNTLIVGSLAFSMSVHVHCFWFMSSPVVPSPLSPTFSLC